MEEIYETFGKNLIFSSVMYLPLWMVEMMEEIDGSESLRPYANRIFLLDRKGNPDFVDERGYSCMPKLLPKKVLLDGNIRELLKYSDLESSTVFEFILEKYVEQLTAYTAISSWMCENVANDLAAIGHDNQDAFKFQYETYRSHKEEIYKRFDVKVQTNETKTDIREDIFRKSELVVGDDTLKNAFKTATGKKDDEEIAKENRNARLKRIKKEERHTAEHMILNQVFGLTMEEDQNINL